jgi:hypothetical protein
LQAGRKTFAKSARRRTFPRFLPYMPEQLSSKCYYIIPPAHSAKHGAVIGRAFHAVEPAFRSVTSLQLFEGIRLQSPVFNPDPWLISDLSQQGAQIQVYAIFTDLVVYRAHLGVGSR